MAIFLHFSPTSSHLYSLQVENCDSNSRLVVDEDDNSKLRLERLNAEMCLKCVFFQFEIINILVSSFRFI